MWLFFVFLSIPLIEIGLFIKVGGAIGLWPTLGVVVITAIVGTWLVKTQGALALGSLRKSLSELDDPTEPLAHGAMILVAGALLLTPGFFTDAVGFTLLIPPVRKAALNYLRRKAHVQHFEMGQNHRGRENRDRNVIDGQFHEVPPTKDSAGPPSGWTKH